MLAFLKLAGLVRGCCQHCHRGLKGISSDGAARVEIRNRADQLAIEDGAVECGNAFRQVRQVVLKFRKLVGDLGHRSAGDPNATILNVEQCSNPIHLRLHDPGMMIVLDGFGLFVVKILP